MERLQTSSHRYRIAAKGTCLVDGTIRSEESHNILTSAKSRSWETAPNNLAHGSHIGGDAETLLCTAEGQSETGDDLVEDEHGTILRRQPTGGFQEVERRNHHTHITGHRLQDDGSNVVAMLQKILFQCLHVIVWKTDGMLSEVVGDTCAGGGTDVGNGRTRTDQQMVGVTVIVAFKLDQRIATCKATGHADG